MQEPAGTGALASWTPRGILPTMSERENGKTALTSRNDVFQILQALKSNRQKRSELGEAFVEGIESIKQAERAGCGVTRILFADYAGLSDWAKGFVARNPRAARLELRNGLYAELADRDEPSELMITVASPRASLSEATLPERPLILVFDRPSDRGNLGSVIRSANAFGVDLVIVHGHGVDARDPKVIRASLGSVFHTPVIQSESHDELASFLSRLAGTCGLKVVGTDSTGATPLHEAGLTRPLAVVIGNEAKGMSVKLKELVDDMVSIPMEGEVNSLNVACAATAILWQISSRAASTAITSAR